ncbi:MAG: agmatine deiminase family protein [Verrucomicrobiota bacterium]
MHQNGNPFNIEDYRMPAEWEPHEATWLAWPHNQLTWPDQLDTIQNTWVEIIEALCPYEKVYVLVNDDCMADEVRIKTGKIRAGLTNIFPVVIPTNDAWMRDAGPIFLSAKKYPSLIAQDFIFNSWGGKYAPWDEDDAVPTRIANKISVPCLKRNFILEGGSIDVNGKGTVMTTTSCLMNTNRNAQFSQKQIEEHLKTFLGVSHAIWLEHGIEGDDTDGHIDDIARFVNHDTIATVVEADFNDANYKPLQENLKKLNQSVDQDGQHFNIVLLPMPNRLDCSFGRCPASYANFYIANNVVLVPTYSCPQDQDALDIIQDLFPTRQIVGIESTPLIVGLGAIHCITQQQPALTGC